MDHSVTPEIAQQLAQAYLEFLGKSRMLFSGKEPGLSLSGEPMVKPDGWVFEVENSSGVGPNMFGYICVAKNWQVFYPTLSPVNAKEKVGSSTDLESLKPYVFAKLNLGGEK